MSIFKKINTKKNNSFMKLTFKLKVIFCVVAFVAQLSVRAQQICAEPDIVPGEVLIKFLPSISRNLKTNLIESLGHKIIQQWPQLGYLRVKIAQGENVAIAIENYKKTGFILVAEPNYLLKGQTDSNDQFTVAGYQWHHNNFQQVIPNFTGIYTTNNPGPADSDIDTPLAWDVITNCSSVLVALVDTGARLTHQDLSSNLWNGGTSYPNHGYDYVNNDNDPSDDSSNSHGSIVAGIMGAVGNNSVGIAGICWQAQIMILKAGAANLTFSSAAIISAITFAADSGAKVINASLGGASFIQSHYDAILYAKNHGVLLVIASGNDGLSLDTQASVYPCMYDLDNIICVGNLDQALEMNTTSNYSPTKVDVGAPGTNLASTTAASDGGYAQSGGGTSFAAPMVTGVAAMNWAYNPNYTYTEVKAAIEGGVRVKSSLQTKVKTGALNAWGTLKFINKPTIISVTQ